MESIIIPEKEIPSRREFIAKQESQHVRHATDFRDKVIERLNQGVEQFGDRLPWGLTAKYFRLRHSEITAWGGYNGAGKSLLIGQIMCWLMQHSGVLIASMEMKPEAIIERMVRQATNTDTPTDSYVDKWLEITHGRFYIYDILGTAKVSRILDAIYWASNEYGVKHVVIDSLATCGIASDDHNGQKKFVDDLASVAKICNIHVHLVVHCRKPMNEDVRPGKYDIKGASDISDMVDNVVIVYRNKKKERTPESNWEKENVKDHDCALYVEKQRYGEWEGGFYLWFHPKSMQYTPDSRNIPMNWFKQNDKYNQT